MAMGAKYSVTVFHIMHLSNGTVEKTIVRCVQMRYSLKIHRYIVYFNVNYYLSVMHFTSQ